MGPGVPTILPSSKRVSPRLGSGSNVWQVLKACEKLGRMVSNDRPEPTPAENVPETMSRSRTSANGS